METLLLMVSVLCQNAPVKQMQVQSTTRQVQQDIQLMRRGWYNPRTGGRCKALRVRYSHGPV